jgi:hypothetical protein
VLLVRDVSNQISCHFTEFVCQVTVPEPEVVGEFVCCGVIDVMRKKVSDFVGSACTEQSESGL